MLVYVILSDSYGADKVESAMQVLSRPIEGIEALCPRTTNSMLCARMMMMMIVLMCDLVADKLCHAAVTMHGESEKDRKNLLSI